MSRFSIPLDQLARKVGGDLETVARKATLQLFTAVAKRSPVDTGRFRANWNVSAAAPDLSITGSTLQGRVNSEAAKALTLPVGSVTYMSNGLPYANRLEFGYSKQAAGGMVRLAAQEFDAHVRKAVASV